MTLEQKVVELRNTGKKWTEIGDALGMSRDAARRAYSRGLGRTFPHTKFMHEVDEETGLAEAPEPATILTKAQIKRRAANLDWPEIITRLRDEVLEDIRAEAREAQINVYTDTRSGDGSCISPGCVDHTNYGKPPSPTGYMLELSPFDLHVGKLSWHQETGFNYDMDITETLFHAAVSETLEDAKRWPLEKIVLVVGQDLLQTDTLEGTTTSGTYVDTDSRYIRSFRRARRLQSWAIRRCAEVAPVDVVVVPGNHDRLSAFHLGEVLAAEFADDPRVTVDNGPQLRKRRRWGVNLIGWTHGSEEKIADLPLIMAHEWKDDWAATKWHEWHTGHLHKAREVRFTAGDSFNGVRVRTLPALCAADAWHYQKGYVGEQRSCEAYLWHKERGYKGHLSSNVLEEPNVAA